MITQWEHCQGSSRQPPSLIAIDCWLQLPDKGCLQKPPWRQRRFPTKDLSLVEWLKARQRHQHTWMLSSIVATPWWTWSLVTGVTIMLSEAYTNRTLGLANIQLTTLCAWHTIDDIFDNTFTTLHTGVACTADHGPTSSSRASFFVLITRTDTGTIRWTN